MLNVLAQAPNVETLPTLPGKRRSVARRGRQQSCLRFGALFPRLMEAGAGSPSPVSSACEEQGVQVSEPSLAGLTRTMPKHCSTWGSYPFLQVIVWLFNRMV